MKRRVFSAVLLLTIFLFISVTAAQAKTIEWGQVKHGTYTQFFKYYEAKADTGFDLTAGALTKDPANMDFIMYDYGKFIITDTKGIEELGGEGLTVDTELPALYETEATDLDPDEVYILQRLNGEYAKIQIKEIQIDKVLFDYVLQKDADVAPGTTTPGTTTPGTTTPGTTTPGTGGGPVTIINNNIVNQNTNTTTNNANTSTNITDSTIANSNIASNNKTDQTTTNDNSIKVTQYVSVMLNGQSLQSDVKPFINGDGRTMLPIRAIAEALGATVQWDADTQTATLTLGAKTVMVTIGQNSILVDGKPISMDTAAAIKDSRTFLPVRPISEAFGAKVGWDEKTSTVKLDK